MTEPALEQTAFDAELIRDVAESFSRATGLGAVVRVPGGTAPVHQAGYTCSSCMLCRYLGGNENCAALHDNSLSEASHFGGKYIYSCRRGLTFFVSPVIGRRDIEARITIGPFMMIELDDFLAIDMAGERSADKKLMHYLAQQIPCVEPQRVEALSRLLFLSVGYANGVESVNAQLRAARSTELQGQINAYIMEIKMLSEGARRYPIELERRLLMQIRHMDHAEANRLLNELLGHILLAGGNSLEWMQVRVSELLVLISRACIDNGSDVAATQSIMNRYYLQLTRVSSFEELCIHLSNAMKELMERSFEPGAGRGAGRIQQAIGYIRANLSGRITLEDVAHEVGLSPEYFSRIFHQETGDTFQNFVTLRRLERATEMMQYDELSIGDIAMLVGFEEQSYFARVFRRAYGVSPAKYRQGLK